MSVCSCNKNLFTVFGNRNCRLLASELVLYCFPFNCCFACFQAMYPICSWAITVILMKNCHTISRILCSSVASACVINFVRIINQFQNMNHFPKFSKCIVFWWIDWLIDRLLRSFVHSLICSVKKAVRNSYQISQWTDIVHQYFCDTFFLFLA